jgi:hypothetical protein
MSDARFVPLTAELLDWALAEGAAVDELLRGMGANARVLRAAMEPPNRAEALLGRGRVLAAAGMILHWPGRAEAWMMVSPFAARRDLVRVVRRCARAIERAQADPVFRRIEMNVLASAPWRHSFAAALGFRLEGVARAWDPLGRDFCVYARVAEG